VNFFCSVEQTVHEATAHDRTGRVFTLDEVAAAAPALWGMMRA